MTRWTPWLLALIVWNAAFDLQVRRAANESTSAHLVEWAIGHPAARLDETLTPRVGEAARWSSAVAGVVLALALVWRRRGSVPS
jgi:hypothetical protein